MVSYAFDRSVCLSTGTWLSSSPSPERATKSAPMLSGTVTSRSKGISRSSYDTRAALGVDALDHEVGLDRDLALVEHATEPL